MRTSLGNAERKRIFLPNTEVADSSIPQGAGIIIKFLTSPPTFLIIQDKEKGEPGFVFGGKDDPAQSIVDADIFDTATRETLEESGIEVRIAKENLLGAITEGDRKKYAKTFFHVTVPAKTSYRRGSEIKWIKTETAAQIDERIARGEFLLDHRLFWLLYKDKGFHL